MTFIHRNVYYQLQKHLQKPQISLVLGPRQAGKTTIIKKLQQDLDNHNQPTVFLNLDIIEDRHFFKSQHTLLDLIEKKVGQKKTYVFIDEISRLKNAGLFLKGLYDLESHHKFIVTGSGSLELKADIIEPLTGRKKVFRCFPLSFTEFAAFKLELSSDDSLELYQQVTIKLTAQHLLRQRLINEYLTFGGYPQVVLNPTQEDKIEVLREIYSSYLEKDIGLLLKVEKELAFENLTKILSHQVGNLVNKAELASTLGLTIKTIEKYLHLLEKTFVINLATPFYRNARKEIIKSPKVYFTDLGLLHIAQGILPTIEARPPGNVFENACFLRLKELDPLKPPQFWRTKSQAEVDFIISSTSTGQPVPIEVKSAPTKNLGRSLISFIKKYQPQTAYILFPQGESSHQYYSINSTKTKIEFMPYHHLPETTIPLF